MANFQLIPGDKNEQYDPGVARLLVPLGGVAKIQLFGGARHGKDSWPLTVGPNAQGLVIVRLIKTNLAAWTFDYSIEGVNIGNVMLEARDFGPTCPREDVQIAQWFFMPTLAFTQLTVYPAYLQSAVPWGKTAYRSTNPRWHNVHWTNMAQAGCGPTSLAIIMDYITSWDNAFQKDTQVCYEQNVTPTDTMKYSSQYGRVADKNLQPQGTAGDTMMDNLGKTWPNYRSDKLGKGRAAVDKALTYLVSGEILIFLCQNGDTYKYEQKKGLVTQHWGGHYMVLVGADSKGSGPHQVFFIEDPSLAKTKFVSRAMLEKSAIIWRVYKQPTKATAIPNSSSAAVGR
ncbi:MAG: C39 family peptidase [Candidatus Acidiferrum sp.]